MNNNLCSTASYNTFSNLNLASEKVLDYLVKNSTVFWQLLYYTKIDDRPLDKPPLTTADIVKMIYRPTNIEDSTVEKNILFVFELDEAFSVGKPQVRFKVGSYYGITNDLGCFEFHIQIIVPNHQEQFIAPYSASASRSLALSLELTKILNGLEMIGSKFVFNKTIEDGIGRNTGFHLQTQNKNYSGYIGTFAMRVYNNK